MSALGGDDVPSDRSGGPACQIADDARADTTEHQNRARGQQAPLAPYPDGVLFLSKFAGKGGWERHPAGDEFVHILDGSAVLHLVTDEGTEAIPVDAGALAIIPQGAWHRFFSAEGVTLMTATPRPSEYVRMDVDDPRTVEAEKGT